MNTQSNDKLAFVARGPWTEQMTASVRAKRITAIKLSEYAGWTDTSIAFLSNFPWIERIELLSSRIKDVSALYELRHLKALSIDGVPCLIDFTSLRSLTDIHIGHWRDGLHEGALSIKGLENLALGYYSGEDLSRIGTIPRLKNFAISYSRIKTLKGIDRAKLLVRLSLARIHHITSLDGIGSSEVLKLLWIEGAKRLKNLDALRNLRNLTTLNLTDCPAIQSLRPIQDLNDLEAVWFYRSTRIADGDLCPLAVLPNLRYSKFVDRKAYSHLSKDFPKNLGFFK